MWTCECGSISVSINRSAVVVYLAIVLYYRVSPKMSHSNFAVIAASAT